MSDKISAGSPEPRFSFRFHLPFADERLAGGNELGRCQWWRVSVISGIPRCDQDGGDGRVRCLEWQGSLITYSIRLTQTIKWKQKYWTIYIFLKHATEFSVQEVLSSSTFKNCQSFFSPHSLHWQCAQQEISKCKFNNIQPFTRINSHQIHNGMWY